MEHEQKEPGRSMGTVLDDVVLGFDRALKTLTGQVEASRPNPAGDVVDLTLEEEDRAHAVGLMRVNHAGEICAQALYEGQALTAKSDVSRQALKSAAQEEIGMRSWVSGQPNIDLAEHIDRKQWRFMGDAAGYAFLSMEQAIADAGLAPEQVSNVRTGIIAGSGGASSASQVEAADILRDRGLRRVGPYRVTQTMGSTVSACLAAAEPIHKRSWPV